MGCAVVARFSSAQVVMKKRCGILLGFLLAFTSSGQRMLDVLFLMDESGNIDATEFLLEKSKWLSGNGSAPSGIGVEWRSLL